MNWLPIKNYENLYEVSDSGHVRSIDRVIQGKDGINYSYKGKVLRHNSNKNTGYLQVDLWKNNEGKSFYVHRLVAEAFINNFENKAEVNHIDGNRQNNLLDNLEWVTRSENVCHAHKIGLVKYTYRLSKEDFIQCLFDVINGESYSSLSQRVPYKVPFLSVKLRKLAKELNIEEDLNESLRIQKIERARINGIKNKKFT